MSCFHSFSKNVRFADFAAAASYCDICPRMDTRARVLSQANGNLDSDIVFVAEAPGRLGADRTLIPLYGDRTGVNFDALLKNVGIPRASVFITNAILCNPRDDNGNNATPTMAEVANCSTLLGMTMNLVRPKVIFTLGRVALEALKFIVPHEYELRNHVGKILPWGPTAKVVPLYHPSPRALIHRKFELQANDLRNALVQLGYEVIAETPVAKQPCLDIPTPFTKLEQVIVTILSKIESLSFFQLTKILYLIDLKSIELFGNSITGQTYIRQREGPWLPRLKDLIAGMRRQTLGTMGAGPQSRIVLKVGSPIPMATDKRELTLISELVERHGTKTHAEIKRTVYLTAPMKYILRLERSGQSRLNKAVIHGDQTIIDIECHKPSPEEVSEESSS